MNTSKTGGGVKDKLKRLNAKASGFISKNKQLFLGLALGALVMLPTGLYLNERTNNKQGVQIPTQTTEVKEVTPTVVQEPAPTAPTTTQPTQTAKPTTTQPKVDQAKICADTNSGQQALLTTTFENGWYNSYQTWKQYYLNDTGRTDEEKETEINNAYSRYLGQIANDKAAAEGVIRKAGCTPTVTQANPRPR